MINLTAQEKSLNNFRSKISGGNYYIPYSIISDCHNIAIIPLLCRRVSSAEVSFLDDAASDYAITITSTQKLIYRAHAGASAHFKLCPGCISSPSLVTRTRLVNTTR